MKRCLLHNLPVVLASARHSSAAWTCFLLHWHLEYADSKSKHSFCFLVRKTFDWIEANRKRKQLLSLMNNQHHSCLLKYNLNHFPRWIWEDLSKPHLIWIKLIFFFQSASLVVLYPYLVIHMRSLGLSTEEVTDPRTVAST